MQPPAYRDKPMKVLALGDANNMESTAVIDIPCILFAEELMDAYPDAQIVLTTRFTAHYDQVHAAARARGRKVLEFKAQDGWGPLCQFLGREAPNEPFPHVNEGDFITRFHIIIFWVRLVGVAKQSLIWATPVDAGGAAWWYFR
ncbi:hypothetical protein APSETT445_000251 [Aspergillus pseudonomiae]